MWCIRSWNLENDKILSGGFFSSLEDIEYIQSDFGSLMKKASKSWNVLDIQIVGWSLNQLGRFFSAVRKIKQTSSV